MVSDVELEGATEKVGSGRHQKICLAKPLWKIKD
jgi:hypothetical protein